MREGRQDEESHERPDGVNEAPKRRFGTVVEKQIGLDEEYDGCNDKAGRERFKICEKIRKAAIGDGVDEASREEREDRAEQGTLHILERVRLL